jgi:hypothetical protein
VLIKRVPASRIRPAISAFESSFGVRYSRILLSMKIPLMRLVAVEFEAFRPHPTESREIPDEVFPREGTCEAETTFLDRRDLDLITDPQVQGLHHIGGETNREAVASLRDLHRRTFWISCLIQVYPGTARAGLV